MNVVVPAERSESRDPYAVRYRAGTEYGSPQSGSPRKSPGMAAQPAWYCVGDFRGCPARGRQLL